MQVFGLGSAQVRSSEWSQSSCSKRFGLPSHSVRTFAARKQRLQRGSSHIVQRVFKGGPDFLLLQALNASFPTCTPLPTRPAALLGAALGLADALWRSRN